MENKYANFKITAKVLDKIGFSEYWDESGDWGGRTLKFSNGTMLRIADFDEKDDDTDGYAAWGTYQPQRYCFLGWFAIPKNNDNNCAEDLMFLGDLHEVIQKYYPECEKEFIDKCTEAKMQWGLLNAKPRYGTNNT